MEGSVIILGQQVNGRPHAKFEPSHAIHSQDKVLSFATQQKPLLLKET